MSKVVWGKVPPFVAKITWWRRLLEKVSPNNSSLWPFPIEIGGIVEVDALLKCGLQGFLGFVLVDRPIGIATDSPRPEADFGNCQTRFAQSSVVHVTPLDSGSLGFTVGANCFGIGFVGFAEPLDGLFQTFPKGGVGEIGQGQKT